MARRETNGKEAKWSKKGIQREWKQQFFSESDIIVTKTNWRAEQKVRSTLKIKYWTQAESSFCCNSTIENT